LAASPKLHTGPDENAATGRRARPMFIFLGNLGCMGSSLRLMIDFDLPSGRNAKNASVRQNNKRFFGIAFIPCFLRAGHTMICVWRGRRVSRSRAISPSTGALPRTSRPAACPPFPLPDRACAGDFSAESSRNLTGWSPRSHWNCIDGARWVTQGLRDPVPLMESGVSTEGQCGGHDV